MNGLDAYRQAECVIYRIVGGGFRPSIVKASAPRSGCSF
jgi:hypothetical protein